MDDASSSRTSGPTTALGGLTGRYGAPMSPFFDFDPAIINPGANEAQWIFPDGAINRPSRGRFELAFGQIGTSVMTGGAIGGLIGGFNGFRTTKATSVGPVPLAVMRSQMLNFITRNGANTANTFGTVAVIYSALGVGLSFLNESHDEFNTLLSGTVTGLLYRGLSEPTPAPAATAAAKVAHTRLRRSLVGGLFGFALSAAYVLLTDREKILSRISRN